MRGRLRCSEADPAHGCMPAVSLFLLADSKLLCCWQLLQVGFPDEREGNRKKTAGEEEREVARKEKGEKDKGKERN